MTIQAYVHTLRIKSIQETHSIIYSIQQAKLSAVKYIRAGFMLHVQEQM